MQIFLSPRRESEETYQFILNVDGVQMDCLGRGGKKWNPATPWKGVVKRGSTGWRAEIEIPFESFLTKGLYPRQGDLWGAGVTDSPGTQDPVSSRAKRPCYV